MLVAHIEENHKKPQGNRTRTGCVN